MVGIAELEVADMLRLVLLGRPGAGKGTQAALVSEEFKIPRLTMSDLLKEEVKRGSSLGKIIEDRMNRGVLVPDEIVYRVLETNISRLLDIGFLLDGFPRNLRQAEWLDKFLNYKGKPLSAVIYLDVDELTVLRRIMGRLVCEKCGRAYNVFYNPPPDIRTCECGGRLYQRKDDCYDKIIKRLNVFNEETMPLIGYYREKGILIRIDASKSVEEVKNDVLSVVRSLPSPYEGLRDLDEEQT